jgi:hypothetical protein
MAKTIDEDGFVGYGSLGGSHGSVCILSDMASAVNDVK